jgi:hypothetical protein
VDSQPYDRLARVLKDVRERFPEDAFTKYQRLRGLLSDHLPDSEREIRIVLDAIDEGVVGVLTETPATELPMQIDRLVLRLETSRGIREDIARQVIQGFAFALDVGELPSTLPTGASPQVEAATAGDDWVGVSEAVGAPAPAQPASQPQPQAPVAPQPTPPPAEPDKFAKYPGGRNGLIATAAGIGLIVFMFGGEQQPDGPGAQPPSPQPGPGTQVPQPGSNPTGGGSTGGNPLIEPGAMDDLPRAGPGAPSAQPQQPGNNPVVQQPRRQQPQVQPQPQGNVGTALWYDPYGTVWNIEFNDTQFQGVGQQGGQQFYIQGQGDPQANQVMYTIADAAGNPVGQGQGYFTDATHIQFVTMGAAGNVIGQGQFHINHPPN